MRTIKHLHIKTITLVLILAAAMNLAACGKSADAKAFVGTWKYEGNNGNSTAMTFNADGSWEKYLYYDYGEHSIKYTGKYVLDDGEKTLTIEVDPLPDDLQFTTEVFYHYLLVGDSLTLSDYFDTAETALTYRKIA